YFTVLYLFLFFFTDPATTAIYTLSLHDALPIFLSGARCAASARDSRVRARRQRVQADRVGGRGAARSRDARSAVSSIGGLPLQALKRTRAGLSATVSDRAGRVDRAVAPGPGGIEG